MECRLCPRECGADRSAGQKGVCLQGEQMRISRIALHPYEEPPICGERGSGTVFFCGCSLGCVFCQNKDISRGRVEGREYTPEQLAREMLALRDMGAANINLVTATHFTDKVVLALSLVKHELGIPVVYNTSGYEKVETLRMLDGLVDIYLPDFKYASSELAQKYSCAPDYPTVVERALTEMYREVGRIQYSSDSRTLQKGMIVRHLVLPGHRNDSIEVIGRLSQILPVDGVLLSLMSQYTPEFAADSGYKNLSRRVTRFEYESVVNAAQAAGFDGFVQGRGSASSEYTPEFS